MRGQTRFADMLTLVPRPREKPNLLGAQSHRDNPTDSVCVAVLPRVNRVDRTMSARGPLTPLRIAVRVDISRLPSWGHELFGEAIRLNQEAIEAYKHRGETLWKQGKRDAAIEDFRQALRLDSTDEDALNALRALDALPSDDKATTAR